MECGQLWQTQDLPCTNMPAEVKQAVTEPSQRREDASYTTIQRHWRQRQRGGDEGAEEKKQRKQWLRDSSAAAGNDSSATGRVLHVRGVGGALEAPGELERLFSAFGKVESSYVRHRIDQQTGANTSWALVTFEEHDAAEKAFLESWEGSTALTGLCITHYSKATAATSTGAMGTVVASATKWTTTTTTPRSSAAHARAGAVACMRAGRRLVFSLPVYGGAELHVTGGNVWDADPLSAEGDDESTAEETIASRLARMQEEKSAKTRASAHFGLIHSGLSKMALKRTRTRKGATTWQQIVAKHQDAVQQVPEPRILTSLSAAGHLITCFCISPNRDVVYTGAMDGSIIAWNFKHGTKRFKVHHHGSEVTAIVAVGIQVFSSSTDTTVRAMFGTTGEAVWLFKRPIKLNTLGRSMMGTSTTSLGRAVNSSGSNLPAEEQCDKIMIAASHRQTHSHPAQQFSTSKKITKAGLQAAMCELLLGNSATEAEQAEVALMVSSIKTDSNSIITRESLLVWLSSGHISIVRGLALDTKVSLTDADSTRMVFSYGDTTVRGIECDTGFQVWSSAQHDGHLVTILVDHEFVFTSDKDYGVRALSAKTGEILWLVRHHLGVVSALTIANGKLFTGSIDETVHALDVVDGSKLWAFDGHNGEVLALATDGDSVFSGGSDNTVQAFDVTSGSLRWKYPRCAGRIRSLTTADGVLYCVPGFK